MKLQMIFFILGMGCGVRQAIQDPQMPLVPNDSERLSPPVPSDLRVTGLFRYSKSQIVPESTATGAHGESILGQKQINETFFFCPGGSVLTEPPTVNVKRECEKSSLRYEWRKELVLILDRNGTLIRSLVQVDNALMLGEKRFVAARPCSKLTGRYVSVPGALTEGTSDQTTEELLFSADGRVYLNEASQKRLFRAHFSGALSFAQDPFLVTFPQQHESVSCFDAGRMQPSGQPMIWFAGRRFVLQSAFSAQ